MSTRKTTLFYAILIAVASTAVGMVIASQWGLPQASSAQTIAAPPMNSAPLAGGLDAATFRNIAKTQVATVLLAAKYSPLWPVVVGTTVGMLLANVPVVLLGSRFADRLPLRAARIGAALLFLGMAVWVGFRGVG